MRSKTKFKIDEAKLKELFAQVGITGGGISTLGAGEFNSVFQTSGGGKSAVIKIAPGADAPTQRYEKHMMRSELYWYHKLQSNTDIRVPEIYLEDTSQKLIPTDYFIMEKLAGITLDKAALTAGEKNGILAEIAKMTAKMHKIKNDKFGYIQQPLYGDWYQAIRGMTELLMADAAKKGRHPGYSKKLLGYIDKYKTVLEKAECCMVNFDLWEPNFMIDKTDGKITVSLIDPERCFWGDRIADFVCLEFMKMPPDKTISINAYNSVAETPVTFSREETIRYAIALGYLGAVMGIEKHYRYSPARFGWWRNLLASKMLTSRAFKLLET